MRKICNKCELEKDIIDFPKNKASKDGYRNYCKKCKNDADKLYKIEYNKKYRTKNRESIKEYNKKYESENKDKRKEYRNINKDRISENRRIYYKKKISNDILFRISRKVRNIIYKSVINKNSKSESILGCTFEDFKLYIESNFENWMTWENYGKYNGELNYGWDIDHIKPLSSAKSEVDIIKLNHYTNLQPLCSKLNRHIKSGKF
jgi:hypothetical protein